MLSNKGFDLWADGYDKSVQLCEEADEYPFAGYRKVLNAIYSAIRVGKGKRILDIGFGTGVLSARLYDEGYEICGIDFSENMTAIAQQRMPNAKLLQWDFTRGLPDAFEDRLFDAIVCTYAIHHVEDEKKIALLREWLSHLAPGGIVLIGDVAFCAADSMAFCRKQAGEEWDDEEFYPVFETLAPHFPGMTFEQISFCSGVFSITA